MTACFPTLNLTFFLNIQGQVNACETAAELQTLIDEAYAQIALLNSNIQQQLDKLTPLLALLEAPEADPAAIVTWITSLISDFLTPLINPTIVLPAQLIQVAAEVAEITALVNEVASAKFPGITINIPSVEPFCTL